VRIVGDSRKFLSFGDVVLDLYPGRGPLAGIHAALHSSQSEWNLVLAVDLPFLTPEFLRFLLVEARHSSAVVTVPSAGSRLHPLCAVYRRQFLVPAGRALAAGRNRIDALFPELPVRTISEDELTAAGFHARMFRNLNTPEDWAAAQRDFD
jgi:molybdopterin-guanine dinucleotide biosynthesis protein A